MLQVGLVKKKEAGESRAYDTFRGRIMFPIADSSGRIVAFSGRILTPDEKSPKYLNSPETSLFNKSEILFGFDNDAPSRNDKHSGLFWHSSFRESSYQVASAFQSYYYGF